MAINTFAALIWESCKFNMRRKIIVLTVSNRDQSNESINVARPLDLEVGSVSDEAFNWDPEARRAAKKRI